MLDARRSNAHFLLPPGVRRLWQSATLSLSTVEHFGMFCAQIKRWIASDLGRETFKRPFVTPHGTRLLSSEGFGRIEIALPEGVDVESEEGIETLNKFSIVIATTDVRDFFHRFGMPLSLIKFFCLRAILAHVSSMTGEMLEGQRLESHTAIWPCWRVLAMGFSWSLFLAQSCNEEKALSRSSLRRMCGDETAQLIHDRSSLVSRGMEVHMCSLTTLERSVTLALGQKIVSKSSNPLVWLFTKRKSTWAWVRHSGQNWTVAILLRRGRISGRALERGSRISGNVVQCMLR